MKIAIPNLYANNFIEPCYIRFTNPETWCRIRLSNKRANSALFGNLVSQIVSLLSEQEFHIFQILSNGTVAIKTKEIFNIIDDDMFIAKTIVLKAKNNSWIMSFTRYYDFDIVFNTNNNKDLFVNNLPQDMTITDTNYNSGMKNKTCKGTLISYFIAEE